MGKIVQKFRDNGFHEFFPQATKKTREIQEWNTDSISLIVCGNFQTTVFIVKKRKRYKWKNKKVDMNYAWGKKDVIEKFLGFS